MHNLLALLLYDIFFSVDKNYINRLYDVGYTIIYLDKGNAYILGMVLLIKGNSFEIGVSCVSF